MEIGPEGTFYRTGSDPKCTGSVSNMAILSDGSLLLYMWVSDTHLNRNRYHKIQNINSNPDWKSAYDITCLCYHQITYDILEIRIRVDHTKNRVCNH